MPAVLPRYNSEQLGRYATAVARFLTGQPVTVPPRFPYVQGHYKAGLYASMEAAVTTTEAMAKHMLEQWPEYQQQCALADGGFDSLARKAFPPEAGKLYATADAIPKTIKDLVGQVSVKFHVGDWCGGKLTMKQITGASASLEVIVETHAIGAMVSGICDKAGLYGYISSLADVHAIRVADKAANGRLTLSPTFWSDVCKVISPDATSLAIYPLHDKIENGVVAMQTTDGASWSILTRDAKTAEFAWITLDDKYASSLDGVPSTLYALRMRTCKAEAMWELKQQARRDTVDAVRDALGRLGFEPAGHEVFRTQYVSLKDLYKAGVRPKSGVLKRKADEQVSKGDRE